MNRRLWLALALFWHLAPAVYAQAAMNSGANATPLPLRNLLIEVRQVQSEDGQQAGVDVQGGRVTGGLAQGRSSGTAVQQILILNGRPARIAVQTQTPLRLLQSLVRNGHIVTTQGTVLIEAGTGFSALPRWEGGDVVESARDAGQVAHAIAVAVLEAARVDLVDHAAAPPVAVRSAVRGAVGGLHGISPSLRQRSGPRRSSAGTPARGSPAAP